MSAPKSKMVWYPCRHSRRDGLYWSSSSSQKTGTLVHEEGNRKNPIRCCEVCIVTAKSGKKKRAER